MAAFTLAAISGGMAVILCAVLACSAPLAITSASSFPSMTALQPGIKSPHLSTFAMAHPPLFLGNHLHLGRRELFGPQRRDSLAAYFSAQPTHPTRPSFPTSTGSSRRAGRAARRVRRGRLGPALLRAGVEGFREANEATGPRASESSMRERDVGTRARNDLPRGAQDRACGDPRDRLDRGARSCRRSERPNSAV